MICFFFVGQPVRKKSEWLKIQVDREYTDKSDQFDDLGQ